MVLESPSSTLALRNRLRLSRPGSYFFGAGGGLGFGLAAAVGVQMAQPDRPVVCVVGEGSAQYAITAFWSAVAYKVPVTFLVLRNSEYAILKWFSMLESVEGAPGPRPAGARRRFRRERLRRPSAQRSKAPTTLSRPCARASAPASRGWSRSAWLRACGSNRSRVALLEPKTERIAPAAPVPAQDRAPDWVAGGTPEPLRSQLIAELGADRVLGRAGDIVRYASDASPYRLFPRAVVMAHDAADVAKVFALAHQTATPVVFRAGGTSLNGQAQSDGILVDVRRHWRGISVEDDGARARVRPGTVLGPRQPRARPVFPQARPGPGVDGLRDRRRRDRQQLRRHALRRDAGLLLDGALADLRAGVGHRDRHRGARRRGALRARGAGAGGGARAAPRRDPRRRRARERIARKFEIKNTTGYRLCAFLDADTPLEIFRRLLVGSEGTLAFIAEAVFDTVPHGPLTSTGLIFFPDIDAAADAVAPLVASRRDRDRADGRARR